MLFKRSSSSVPDRTVKLLAKQPFKCSNIATRRYLHELQMRNYASQLEKLMSHSTWDSLKVVPRLHLKHHGENNLLLLNYMLEGGDSTVRMQARWNHLLTPVSNVTATADRQKIQMNALFLPGLERSWWRGVLSGSCWLLASWDCSTVEGHCVLYRQNQTAESEFVMQPQMAACATWASPRVSRFHLNQYLDSTCDTDQYGVLQAMRYQG